MAIATIPNIISSSTIPTTARIAIIVGQINLIIHSTKINHARYIKKNGLSTNNIKPLLANVLIQVFKHLLISKDTKIINSNSSFIVSKAFQFKRLYDFISNGHWLIMTKLRPKPQQQL